MQSEVKGKGFRFEATGEQPEGCLEKALVIAETLREATDLLREEGVETPEMDVWEVEMPPRDPEVVYTVRAPKRPPKKSADDLYAMEPISSTKDPFVMRAFFNECLFEDIPEGANKRVEQKVLHNPYIDGHRVQELYTMWFDDKPFGIGQEAGRGGSDHLGAGCGQSAPDSVPVEFQLQGRSVLPAAGGCTSASSGTSTSAASRRLPRSRAASPRSGAMPVRATCSTSATTTARAGSWLWAPPSLRSSRAMASPPTVMSTGTDAPSSLPHLWTHLVLGSCTGCVHPGRAHHHLCHVREEDQFRSLQDASDHL